MELMELMHKLSLPTRRIQVSKRNRQDGFTIIELLIAMSIFTVVLLVLTGAIVQIGRLYYKGMTASRTQEAARNVVDDITRSIQYTPGKVLTSAGYPSLNTPAPNKAICIGQRRYSYVQGQQTKVAINQRSLVVDDAPSSCTLPPSALNVASNGVTIGNSMLSDGMRLAKLVVEDKTIDPTLADGAYRVTVRIVYGDDDLLCVESGVLASGATCNNATQMSNTEIAGATNLRCKDIRSGSEFCAMSELSTIVERRLR